MNSSKGKTSKSRSSECRQMAIYVIPALKMCLENVRGGTEGGGIGQPRGELTKFSCLGPAMPREETKPRQKLIFSRLE